jgi:hypothetical protein
MGSLRVGVVGLGCVAGADGGLEAGESERPRTMRVFKHAACRGGVRAALLEPLFSGLTVPLISFASVRKSWVLD